MRRTMAAFASIALAAGTIALATPAHAGSYFPVCSATTSSNISGNSHTFTIGGVCDRVIWDGTGPGTSGLTTAGVAVDAEGTPVADADSGPPTPVSSGDVVTFTYNGPASGVLVLSIFRDTAPTNTASYAISVTGTGGGGNDDSGASGSAGSAPAPVMQQFGLPSSGNCEDGYSDSMNWSGVGSGGWGISWAQWVNDGAGGAVCSRTVMYNTSTAKWVVG